MKFLKTLWLLLLATFCCPEECLDGAVTVQVGQLTKVTAYCPCKKCCGKWSDGQTACGHRINYGDRFVAADANIPFGTMLIVPGYNNDKPVPVLDRGGAITGNQIDVLFYEKSKDPDMTDLEWSHQKALEWDVQYLEVMILRNGY